MASYDVAVWLRTESMWPQITMIVQTATARDAVLAVLHARKVHRAVKVAVNADNGAISRWYGVTTLADGFVSQRATCLPMGMPIEQEVLVASGGGIPHES
ncbi:MAG TPA: hypothetical protein VJ761_20395 [Ktedonobacteraceae bacterium]|nr:hypothetical protein [Ktedonobacteraceae bacterium]